MAKRSKRVGYALSFILFIAICSIGVILVFYLWQTSYTEWRTDTFSSGEVVMYSTVSNKDGVRDGLEEKIDIYANSELDVEFVEINYEEVVVYLFDEVSGSLPTNLVLQDVGIQYIEANQLRVYFDINYQTYGLPWMVVDVHKDDYETAELYVTRLSYGDTDMTAFMGGTVETINTSYRDALLAVNANGFTLRTYDNIEISSEGLIVKGRLNP